jgi:hypothetical protein
MTMPFKPGHRLRSQVCTTEVIVVRPPTDDLDLRCGGQPLVEITTHVDIGQGNAPAPGFNTGTQLGKRYTTGDTKQTLELLATKAGDGTLSVADVPLILKEAKPLPSSD